MTNAEKAIVDRNDVVALESRGAWEDLLPASNIFELIAGTAAAQPNAPALTFLADGEVDEEPLRLSYAQLLGRITQAANMFHSLGVGPDDAVSFLLPNLPHAQIVMWGAATAGIANPVNLLLQPDHLAHLLTAAKTKVLVALGPHPQLDVWQKVEAIRDRVPTLETVLQVGAPSPDAENHDKILFFDQEIASQPADRLIFERKAERGDLSTYFHTGGTTGAPKLATHTQDNDIYCAWAAAKMWNMTPQSIVFNVLPMFHIAGSLLCSLAPLSVGAEIVILTPAGLRHLRALANFWQLAEKYRPTHLGGVPTNMVALMNVPVGDADVSSIRYTVTGGAALPADLERSWQKKLGMPITQMYGMTEIGLLATTPVEGRCKIGSTGIRVPYSELKIVADDDQNKELGANEKGVVMARSPGVFPGYTDSSHNADLLADDGWVYTGDLGYIDDENYLYITGRARDVIIRGGHNIDPSVIEEALSEHPAVALAAAVGRLDAYAGELPVAYAQLQPGAEADPAELRDFLAERISERPALPKEVVIIDTMPVTTIGKIFKPALRREQAAVAVRELLTPLTDDGLAVTIQVVEGKLHEMSAHITVEASDADDPAAVEKEIVALLSRLTLSHQIEWT